MTSGGFRVSKALFQVFNIKIEPKPFVKFSLLDDFFIVYLFPFH